MADFQSRPAPVRPLDLTWRDLAWLSPAVLRALFELARARLIFGRLGAREIVTRNRAVAGLAACAADARQEQLVERVSHVLPRLACRLPWRADCLVQAIAGQNWLAAHGLASETQIGVEKPADGEFGAHAWLVHDQRIVCGGEIERYAPLLARGAMGHQSRDAADGKRADPGPAADQ